MKEKESTPIDRKNNLYEAAVLGAQQTFSKLFDELIASVAVSRLLIASRFSLCRACYLSRPTLVLSRLFPLRFSRRFKSIYHAKFISRHMGSLLLLIG